MKTLTKNLILSTSLIMALTACSTEKTEQIRITANQQMNSQDLANSGEQLMMPHSLHLADRVFEMALEKDPENKKAQFYRAFLKRFMIFEGVLTRVSPYVETYGNKAQFQKTIENLPNHPAKSFLLTPKSGATALKNAADLQNLLVEYRKAAQSFRKFITDNADIELELYMNPYLFAEAIETNQKESCQVSPNSTDTDIEVTCDFKEVAAIKVNMADLLALKQMAAGEIIMLAPYTSYSVGSIADLGEKAFEGLSAKDAMAKAETVKDAGVLLKGESLSTFRSLGSDFAVGMKWAMQYQGRLCRVDNYGKAVARKGFLMKDICIDNPTEAQKTLAVIEKVLAGPMRVNLASAESEVKYEKNVNFMAIFDKPIQNLRSIMPASWNQDGTAATSLRDKTLGGLLPDADADDFFKNNSVK